MLSAKERIVAAFQVFRAAAAKAMGHSTTLVTSVSGGVLRSSIQTLPGTATWVTTMAM